jgi:hypothetical protein
MAVNYGGGAWPWGYYCTGTSASTIQTTIWANWVNQTQATTINNSAYNVWNAWNIGPIVHQSQRNAGYNINAYQAPVRREPTAAELKAQKERQEAYRIEREHRRKLMDAAHERATELLLECLDEKQKADYLNKKQFDVEVGGRKYRIQPGTHGNVYELEMDGEKEVTIRRFCIPSRIRDMPEPDVHLAQKLMIEGAMPEFERIANISEYRARRAVAA